jgi:hypothetical protein
LLKVDFHSHTHYSPDSLTTIEEFIHAARISGLDRLVVTDHNCLAGAREAYAAAPDLVIIGEEVQTTQGEFLAVYVTEELPKGLDWQEALKRLKDQNAFISLSHPFDPQRSGWPLETLIELAPQVDAIEVFNARVLKHEHNNKAMEFARKFGLAGTAGTDGHHPSEIGKAYSIVPDFHDADSLRLAIKTAEVSGSLASPFVHFYSSWARVEKQFRKK